MKVTIEVDPESTAYIFDNAFHYRWFGGAKVVAPIRSRAFETEHEHHSTRRPSPQPRGGVSL